LRRRLANKEQIEFDSRVIQDCMYRPFTRMNSYYSEKIVESPGIWKNLFPQKETENIMIAIPGLGSKKDFNPLISNKLSDLEFNSKTQYLPLYWYKETSIEQRDLFYTGQIEYQRNDGITDFILERAREKYGPRVMKEDIFYYVYGILHSKSYATKFADDLKMSLPRLPLVSEPQKFWTFSKAGRELSELHLNYEDVPACPDVVVEGDNGNYLVDKMRYPSKEQKDTIIYNNSITIKNIPSKAYEYIVNGKSAIAWIMERYAVTVDKDSGIKNDPNDWAKEHNKPRYILDLLLSVINVSCQTVDIVNSLPEVDWDNE
jgi:predicted helicase